MPQKLSEKFYSSEKPFLYGAEVVNTRGIPVEGSPSDPFALANALLADPRIDWVSITDNPGGGPMLPPDWLAGLLPNHDNKIVLHLACKDANRIGLESAAWRYAAEGFDNILALSGDLPTGGYPTRGTGVFDYDSVSLINLLANMNAGLEVPNRKGTFDKLSPTNFFIGCAVSPFKKNENELVPQYYKLLKKIKAGAKWVLPQLGYDMRKFNEIKLFLDENNINVPVIGNVYVLTKTVAKMFNSGKLAGCVVSDELVAEAEKYAAGPDKGKSYFYELAAKQLAVFKGLGFSAGYIGGVAKPEAFFEIIELAGKYSPDDWKTLIKDICFAQKDEFFYYEHDPNTKLSQGKVNPAFTESLKTPQKTKNVNLFYKFSRCVHATAFHKNHGLYNVMARVFKFLEKNPNEKTPNPAQQGTLYKLVHWLEKDVKHTLYGCTDCGDCGLPDTAYLCPMNSCSKNMRNGPCGGSFKSRCESEDKDCVWTIAYDRLKCYKETEQLLDAPVITYNAALKNTSAWSNLYMNRDHGANDK
ncbi:MAG: methylenetetrahydrofolate reductase C-terminal domain-containing protein [Thermoguttaceae bacterium]